MGTLLQQREIPVTKFRRPLGGDFLMGQETLQEQGWIIMAQEVENFTDPETGSGIGDDIEACTTRPAQELDLLEEHLLQAKAQGIFFIPAKLEAGGNVR